MFDPDVLFQKLVSTLQGWIESAVVMLPNLVVALLVVSVAHLIGGWVRSFVHRLVERMSGNPPFSQMLANLARFAVLGTAVFVALGLLKLDKTVTSLLAGIGVVGLALGFAFQDIAANFMSGFLMALRSPFDADDLVEVSGHRGRIVAISLRATELETLDGLSVLIPNKDVFQSAIVNYTRTSIRRVDVAVGTAYCDDMQTVKDVVTRAVQDLPNRQADRATELYFEAFGDSSINCTVRVWLAQADELTYLQARSDMMMRIKKALDDASLTIPFPIRTLDFGAKPVGGTQLHEAPLRVVNQARA